jgi:Cu+-exporting ATPase
VGTVLTTPVAFAVMASEVFGAGWVPELLLNRWFQLALIAPVMCYAGWPIHRIGWLSNANWLRRFTAPPLPTAPPAPSDLAVSIETGHDTEAEPDTVTDPVCGMRVDPTRAAATAERGGIRYWFCSTGCRDAFLAGCETTSSPATAG